MGWAPAAPKSVLRAFQSVKGVVWGVVWREAEEGSSGGLGCAQAQKAGQRGGAGRRAASSKDRESWGKRGSAQGGQNREEGGGEAAAVMRGSWGA